MGEEIPARKEGHVMKDVIVIIDPKSRADLQNILKDAAGGQQAPPEVKQISDRAWLIDLHKSLAFFSGLLHSANTRHIDAFVFAVEDVIHVPNGGPMEIKCDFPKKEYADIDLKKYK